MMDQKMRPFEIIKHIRCVDVAFLVKKCQYSGPTYSKVRGWWINVASSKPNYISYEPETITISKAERLNWKVIELPNLFPDE